MEKVAGGTRVMRIVCAVCEAPFTATHRCGGDQELLEDAYVLLDDVAHDRRLPDDVQVAALAMHKRIGRHLARREAA